MDEIEHVIRDDKLRLPYRALQERDVANADKDVVLDAIVTAEANGVTDLNRIMSDLYLAQTTQNVPVTDDWEVRPDRVWSQKVWNAIWVLVGQQSIYPAVTDWLDEANLTGSRAVANFTGAGVTVTDDTVNKRVNITIPGYSDAQVLALLTDANIPNNLTLDNITQITNRAISDTTGTLAIGRGGTSNTDAQSAIDALTQVLGATNEYVLTKDTATGNAKWKAPTGGGVPTAITVLNEAGDATCFPLFTTTTTGDLGPKTNTNLTYNSTNGTLGAVTFQGSGLTADRIAASDASKNIVSLNTATYPSLTELSYVKNVTSAIQTQLNGKQASDSELTSLAGLSVTQGDLIYASAADTYSKLAKDTNATRYLSNTGASNNPAWAQINLANGVTGLLPQANIDNSGVDVIEWLSVLVPDTSYATLDSRPTGDTVPIPVPCWDFDASTEEYLAFLVRARPTYQGSNITVRLCWRASSATSGSVRWGVAIRVFKDNTTTDDIDDSFTYTWNEATGTAPSAGTGTSGGTGVTRYTDVTVSSLDSWAAGEMAILVVRREPGDGADDMLGDAELITVHGVEA